MDKTNKVYAKKSLGQHYLKNPQDFYRIVKYAKLPCKNPVLEVGPGPGGLTKEILKSKQKIFCLVEKDKYFIQGLNALCQKYKGCKTNIINDDILRLTNLLSVTSSITNRLSNYLINKLKLSASFINLFLPVSLPWVILANLPYYISSPFLLMLCKESKNIDRAIIMLQKEMVQRIIAKDDNKSYGRLSIQIQLHFNVKLLSNYNANRFRPAPKVASSLIELIPKSELPTEQEREVLASITFYAFSQRRKVLKNSLAKHPLEPLKFFAKLGLNDGLRAENLTKENYLELTKIVLLNS